MDKLDFRKILELMGCSASRFVGPSTEDPRHGIMQGRTLFDRYIALKDISSKNGDLTPSRVPAIVGVSRKCQER